MSRVRVPSLTLSGEADDLHKVIGLLRFLGEVILPPATGTRSVGLSPFPPVLRLPDRVVGLFQVLDAALREEREEVEEVLGARPPVIASPEKNRSICSSVWNRAMA